MTDSSSKSFAGCMDVVNFLLLLDSTTVRNADLHGITLILQLADGCSMRAQQHALC